MILDDELIQQLNEIRMVIEVERIRNDGEIEETHSKLVDSINEILDIYHQ